MSGLDLPAGWLSVPLRDVVVDVKTSDPALKPNTNITYFDISSIDREAGMVTDAKVVLGAEAPSRARQVVQVGDVLFSTVRPNLRAIAQVPSVSNGMASTGFCVLRAAENVESKYLHYFVRSEEFLDALLPLQRGSSYPAVRSGDVLSQLIPLAPAAEQTRIVEKLEELLSDLDAGVAELKAAQKKLGQYRQSLLKAAVEGALTADWRKSQKTKPAESGAQLLKRILHERRTRWEAKQLAKFKEQGKTPAKGWQSKYAEPVTPETAGLPELPKEWVWASLDMLSEIQGGIQKQPSRIPTINKYPFLRVANVARGLLKLDDVHEIELFAGELERLTLLRGDVLIVEGNGSLSEIGRCALWDGSIENVVHQNHLIRARPIVMLSEFVESWLNSLRAIEKLTKLAATTSGLYTLSVGKISKIPVPVPPMDEQVAVIAMLASALEGQRYQDEAIKGSLKQATAQRKNILKAAFSGQLVPQDPQDEPASALLARIRAERVKQGALPKVRKSKIRKDAHA